MDFYHYPKCSTCRNAARWLKEHGHEVRMIDIVDAPPSPARLRDYLRRSGLELTAFFNRSGQSYRAGNFKDRLAQMSEAQMLQALARDGKLIRRPLLDTGDRVLVGFRADEYSSAF